MRFLFFSLSLVTFQYHLIPLSLSLCHAHTLFQPFEDWGAEIGFGDGMPRIRFNILLPLSGVLSLRMCVCLIKGLFLFREARRPSRVFFMFELVFCVLFYTVLKSVIFKRRIAFLCGKRKLHANGCNFTFKKIYK